MLFVWITDGQPSSDDAQRGTKARYCRFVTMIESLDRLRTEIGRFVTLPYLLTITAADQPHCGNVTVSWGATGDELVVSAPSSWAGSEAGGHRQVSLLWPPAEPGGYSLIVDGRASTLDRDGETLLAVAISRAVLYRLGSSSAGDSSLCGSDCVPLFTR